MSEQKRQPDVEIVEKPVQRMKEPPQYRVILLNDDYTTMDFVVVVLERIFQKSPAEAYRIMMKVHIEGQGEAGVYPHEVAETKVERVHDAARARGFPLRCSLEEVRS
ncbi:MAG: ATP-dependent Clp protease adapter ClpS [Acidobacteriota bacterium]